MIDRIRRYLGRDAEKQELYQIHESIKEKIALITGYISKLDHEIELAKNFLEIVSLDRKEGIIRQDFIVEEMKKEITKKEKIIEELEAMNNKLSIDVFVLDDEELTSMFREDINKLISLQSTYIGKAYDQTSILFNTIGKIMNKSLCELPPFNYN